MVKKYSLIAIAALVYALGVGVVLEPAHLVTGGVTGMGIVLNYVILALSIYKWNVVRIR